LEGQNITELIQDTILNAENGTFVTEGVDE